MTDVKDGKLSDFRPQKDNANAHTERGLKLLGNAYSEVGYVAPMTATADGEIIDGSARLEVAFDQFPDDALIVRHDGQRPVIMVREDIVSADTPEAKKISYSANRVGELDLSWNPETILADLDSGVDLSGLFREDELSEILGELGKAPQEDPGAQVDKAAELQAKWGTSLGQIWELGEHRLACGDCTDKAAVGRLLKEKPLNLMPADPPYNVGIEYGDGTDDNKADEMYKAFCLNWFGLWQSISDRQIITPGYNNLALWSYLFGKPYHISPWTKTNSMTRGHVSRFACYEPILFFGRGWNRERHNDIFEYPVSEQSFIQGEKLTPYHPCPKPLKMWVDLIENYSNAGDLVGDPFLGSGTTLIACEQLGRRCRGIEISPAYVGVTLERWHTMTSKDPVLTNA